MSELFPIPYPSNMHPEAEFAVEVVDFENVEEYLRERGYSEEAIKENIAEIEKTTNAK